MEMDISNITVRAGRLSDIALCERLDASFTTDLVWQIALDSYGIGSEEDISLRLLTARLPRPRAITDPPIPSHLESKWDRLGLFLVAEIDKLVGFLCASIEEQYLRIEQIVVDKPFRRLGIGNSLMGATISRARENHMKAITCTISTKNYPGITFFRSQGFHICGYNEKHFTSGDIAIYMALELLDE